MHHPSGARKREWSSATTILTTEGSRDHNHVLVEREDGEVIEKEMKRLRLAKEDDEQYNSERRWPTRCHHDGGEDVDMDMDGDFSHHQLQFHHGKLTSTRFNYKPINSTLRECHYLRQLRKFQAERVSYLERRAPTDAAAAALIHAMQGHRR